MAASYPTSVASFTTKYTGQTIEASDINDPQAEIVAIESDLIAGLPAARGGTGATSYTTGDMLVASSASSLSKLSAVASGQVLASAGASTAPAYTANPAVSSVVLNGSTSGTTTVKPAATAGTTTLTLPAGTTDFSATGGTSQVVRQSSVGAALTVSQLAASDLSNTTTGTGKVVLDSGPTFSGDVNVAATKKVYLDGGGNTYLVESSADNVSLQVGGAERLAVSTTLITPTLPITNAAQFRCGAYHNTTQSANDSTWTTVSLNSEDYDVGSMHDTVTNNSRVTVPTNGGGLYLVVAMVCYDANATGVRSARLIKNGSTASPLQQSSTFNGGASNSVTVTMTNAVSLSAADYIEVQGWQNSGGALLLGSTARPSANMLQLVKLW